MRIQKALASLGVGSRRQIEKWILNKQIFVNNQPAQIGQPIEITDKVTLDGKLISLSNLQDINKKPQVLLYNKPEGEVSTRFDPENRPTVFANLPELANARWINIGRLDINSSGLLVFTDQGEYANQLMHPKNNYLRKYLARVFFKDGFDKKSLEKLTKGVKSDGEFLQAKAVKQIEHAKLSKTINTANKRNIWFEVTLAEGKNREIRRLFAAIDGSVSRLIRTEYGPYKLPRNLKEGEYIIQK